MSLGTLLVNVLMAVAPMMSVGTMMPRKWSSRHRRASRRRTQSGQSGHSEDEQQMELDELLHAHASSSDDAIDNPGQLGDRIPYNNDAMRECKDTFVRLERRKIKLTMELRAMRDRLSIPTWHTGTGSRSSRDDANLRPVNPVNPPAPPPPQQANVGNQPANRPIQLIPPRIIV